VIQKMLFPLPPALHFQILYGRHPKPFPPSVIFEKLKDVGIGFRILGNGEYKFYNAA